MTKDEYHAWGERMAGGNAGLLRLNFDGQDGWPTMVGNVALHQMLHRIAEGFSFDYRRAFSGDDNACSFEEFEREPGDPEWVAYCRKVALKRGLEDRPILNAFDAFDEYKQVMDRDGAMFLAWLVYWGDYIPDYAGWQVGERVFE